MGWEMMGMKVGSWPQGRSGDANDAQGKSRQAFAAAGKGVDVGRVGSSGGSGWGTGKETSQGALAAGKGWVRRERLEVLAQGGAD